jgi:threonine synthase
MRHVLHLKCLLCGREYPPDGIRYICPNHGNEGILDVQYDYNKIAATFSRHDLHANNERSIWRYKPLLPVAPESPVPPIQVGWTPLYEAPRLASLFGLHHLWVKDESRQPTASFKDRASAIAIVKAQETNTKVMAAASTGNAGAALSGLCASVGMPNVIFVPASAPEAKIAQLLVFGSIVLLIEGTYDNAFALCLEASEKYHWYNRNTGFNPYMTEGKKTAIFEICEQLNWMEPDALFIPVGDGCIIGGFHKGLKDLLALGWIQKMPRLFGVQASGSAALYHAWKEGRDPMDIKPIKADTIADSLSVGLPRDRIKAMRAVRETGGAFIAVNDEKILQAISTLACRSGVFPEPAGAATLAGLSQAVHQGLVSPQEKIVIVVTGSGLKDIRTAVKAVEMPRRIEPRLEAVENAMRQNPATTIFLSGVETHD